MVHTEHLKMLEPSLLDEDPTEDTRLPSVDDFWVEREAFRVGLRTWEGHYYNEGD